MSWLTSVLQMIIPFKEAALTTGDVTGYDDFEDYGARLLRYDIAAAQYENTVYRTAVHTWAESLRTAFGLYKAVRNIYNPTYRAVEFWRSVIWGGLLDPKALETGAVPVVTQSEQLRNAIALILAESNWALNKDLVTLYGVNFGDVGIKIVDDVKHQSTYLEVVHPGNILDVTLDRKGHVKGYIIVERRYDETGKLCEYREEVTRGIGEQVIFKTFKDRKPFAWNGVASEWTELYGFVPLCFIRHNFVGSKYGWSELHSARSKIFELDDVASKLHDYIRKTVDPIWLFNFRKPRKPVNFQESTGQATTSNPAPTREEVNAIYADIPSAKAQPLVTDMVDVEKVAGELQKLIAELEREYPELQMDIWTAGGYTTGKALRTARQRVEKKVLNRRTSYDLQLLKAIQMGIAIGGYRGYVGFEGFDLESYAKGELAFTIPTARPIFNTDALEEIEAKQVMWTIVALAKKNGLPIDEVLRDIGWSESRITRFMSTLEELRSEMEEDVSDQEAIEGDPVNAEKAADATVEQQLNP